MPNNLTILNNLDFFKNDIQKTWKVINSVLNKDIKGKQTINKIIYENREIHDSKEICNAFSKYISNTGSNLALKNS